MTHALVLVCFNLIAASLCQNSESHSTIQLSPGGHGGGGGGGGGGCCV